MNSYTTGLLQYTYHAESIAYYSLGRKRILAELSTTYHIFWQSSDAEISPSSHVPSQIHFMPPAPILAIRLHSVSRSVAFGILTEGEEAHSLLQHTEQPKPPIHQPGNFTPTKAVYMHSHSPPSLHSVWAFLEWSLAGSKIDWQTISYST